jgi:alginate O-acetyltransferase complex protein AlgJ
VSKLAPREGAEGNGRLVTDPETVWGNGSLFTLVKDDKVVEGKDGWFFLDNDSNGFLRQYAGEIRLWDEALELWRDLLETRIARVGELGARYHFLVVPESATVYPENLPDGIEAAPERPVHQVMRHLASKGSPAKVIYPLEDLLAEKTRRLVYRKTDTHWNDFGALVAYRRLAWELERDVPVHVVGEDELQFFEIEIPGDLGYKVGIEARPELCARYLYSRARSLYDNCVESDGSLIITECPHAPPTKCVIFGDSSCYGMVTYLAQSFGRMVLVNSPTLDYDLIAEERPDLVVSQMVERYLIAVPDDSTARSIRESETAKLAEGRLRPRVVIWDPAPELPADSRAPSIETVESVRAQLHARGRREDALLVSVMAYAGLSPSEALRLSWQQLEDDTLRVEPAYTEYESRETRQLRYRSVPLLEPLAADLAEWRAACGSPQSGWVFPRLRRRDWQQWTNKIYRPALRRAGRAGPGPGALCDTFATLLIADGRSPSEVARLVGIERADVFDRYWYKLEETLPGGDESQASDRIKAVRVALEADTHTAFSRAGGMLSRLRSALTAPGGPGWERLAEDSLGVRPLSVDTVESIRARMLARGDHEAATFVSVMAYAGLAQDEALRLKWREVGDSALAIEPPPASAKVANGLCERSVPLLDPAADDLKEWRAACGSPELGWVFPNLRRRSWQEWIHDVYGPAARSAPGDRRRPYHLRHTFASLMIEEGVELGELARQMALSGQEVAVRYGQLFEEPAPKQVLSSSARIRAARAANGAAPPRR